MSDSITFDGNTPPPASPPPVSDAPAGHAPGSLVYRHKLATRLWHWTNVVAVLVMLMSGLMIFNAHPRLYWGDYGATFDPAWLVIGHANERGFLQLGNTVIDTTGWLGRWTDPDGNVQNRAFPWWATIPSDYNLALARRWHLFFAWIFAFGLLFFMLGSLFNRHFQKDLAFRREELKPGHIWADIKDHLKLKFHNPHNPLSFNILQKFSYVGVIFILLPLIIFTGLAMSPAMVASWPFLNEVFGGRQSARSIHFIAAMLIAGFILLHLALVVLAGPYNEVRSMITGKFRLPKEQH